MSSKTPINALVFLILLSGTLPTPASANGGKLLESAGVTQFEGSGGGGLVPWATLS